MSTKRNKKNVADMATNNNYKRSKNAASIEVDSYDSVKLKNREKATILSSNKNLAPGNKRKLSDTDVSPSKQIKKRGKIYTISLTEDVDLPSEPSDNLNFHKEIKKSKKKTKLPIINESFINETSSNNILEPFVQKVGKKKKLCKDKISVDHVNTLVEKTDMLTQNAEVDSNNCGVNAQLNINNCEDANIQNEQCISNGRIQDLEDNQSDLNKTELFSQLVKKENSEGK